VRAWIGLHAVLEDAPHTMSRRKRGTVVVAVLAALACWLLVRGRCGPGGDAASQAPGEAQRSRELRRAVAALDPGTQWSLYGQRNVARQRIVGRVSFEGRPFAGRGYRCAESNHPLASLATAGDAATRPPSRSASPRRGAELRTLRVIVGHSLAPP
jgi:hypothetical protein